MNTAFQWLISIGLLFVLQSGPLTTGSLFDQNFVKFEWIDGFEDVFSNLAQRVITFPMTESPRNSQSMGPLTVHPDNPRYFANARGEAVFLTGSHTWCNFQNCTLSGQIEKIEFDAFLDMLEKSNHNFMRLWRLENYKNGDGGGLSGLQFSPMPYLTVESRESPAPKFDLERFNNAYFDRLRTRVEKARERGIYVSIMLFNGWTIESKSPDYFPWSGHPYNAVNNVNGINGDLNENAQGEEMHLLREAFESGVIEYQKAYVRKVIETVNDLDNVLYEISNESSTGSRDWQYYLIDYIKRYQSTLPFQHPVGMTVPFPAGNNADLLDSNADWISPSEKISTDGMKVVIYDTDHLCGICGKRRWIWEALTDGANWIFMDPYDNPLTPASDLDADTILNIRKNMGYASYFADRLDLGTARPKPDLCSSSHCLAGTKAGRTEILTYIPDGSEVELDLSSYSDTFEVEWLNPANGHIFQSDRISGNEREIRLSAPFVAEDAVLYLHSTKPAE